MELYFFDRYLVQKGYKAVRMGQTVQQNSECTGLHGQDRHCGFISSCGSTTICLKNNEHPSLAIRRTTGGVCYAALAYDSWNLANDGRYYAKSRLDIVNITNESSPSLVKAWISTSASFTWNQELSQAVATDGNNSLGWFWQSDNQNACHTGEEGAVNSNFGLTNMSATGKFNGVFPLVNFPGGFFTDYNIGAQGVGSGGYLFPAWNQAVANTAGQTTNCQQCTVNGVTSWYNIGSYMARILP